MHLVLSGEDPDIIIGNFIADHIRGSRIINELPNPVKKGILLHRAIDSYSDTHHSVRHSVKLLRSSHYHYAPVAIDILYDHFLIKNWKQFVKISLGNKIASFYSLLENRLDSLPAKSRKISLKIIEFNWFEKYETFEGLEEVFAMVDRRASFRSELPNTVKYLLEFYNELEEDFLSFAPDIFTFVSLHNRYKM
jgi:acyl carrier protein phosphodiesterase